MKFRGMELLEGNYLYLTGMTTKGENDIYVVASDYSKPDERYSVVTNQICLKKVKLNGELKTSGYNIVFLDEKCASKNPNMKVTLTTKEGLKEAKKEVNSYLKSLDKIETVVEFKESSNQTVKPGCYIKFKQGFKCGVFGTEYFSNSVMWKVINIEDKEGNPHLRIIEVGKRGQELSNSKTASFVPTLSKKLIDNNIIVFDRIEMTKEEYNRKKATKPVEKTIEKVQEKITKPEITPVENNIEISYNEEKNGIEIKFTSKPNENILMSLKENGFRWHRVKKIWYAKDTKEIRDFVKSFIPSNGKQEENNIAPIEGEIAIETNNTVEDKEKIFKKVDIKELSVEESNNAIIEALEPNINKNDTIEENNISIEKNGGIIRKYAVKRIVRLTEKQFDYFKNNLLDNYNFLENIWSYSDNIEEIPVCCVVYNGEKFIVDTQGYNYVRYLCKFKRVVKGCINIYY